MRASRRTRDISLTTRGMLLAALVGFEPADGSVRFLIITNDSAIVEYPIEALW
jgi:hypothetical protein